jgi:hypothetical protein
MYEAKLHVRVVFPTPPLLLNIATDFKAISRNYLIPRRATLDWHSVKMNCLTPTPTVYIGAQTLKSRFSEDESHRVSRRSISFDPPKDDDVFDLHSAAIAPGSSYVWN